MIAEEKLRTAARELNKIVSPNVDEEGDVDAIVSWIEKVLGAVPPVIMPTDVFTPVTTEVLNYLQTPDDERDDYTQEDVPEPFDDSLLGQIRSAKKLRELKDIVNANEELKSLRGTLGKYQDTETLRDKMLETLTAISSSVIVEEERPRIIISTLFQDACPKLSDEEFADLEKLILKDGKILQPLLLWNNTLVDGHNRYAIALKNNLPFTTKDIQFKNEQEAYLWIKENAISQRNLSDYAKYELIKDIESVLKKEAKERQSLAGKGIKVEDKKTVREEMAKKIDVSPSQLRKLKKFDETASKEQKKKAREGKIRIGSVLKEIPREIPLEKKVSNAVRDLEKFQNKYLHEEQLKEFVIKVNAIIEEIATKFNLNL
jgi:hypothetical protein